jgi:ADP-ribose pyrophosphatase
MTDKSMEETFLSGEKIFHGKIIDVERWQVLLPNGKTALREVVKHPGAAAIVPVDDKGYVTMVRQCRIAVGRFTWEIPAGKLDYTGEDPLECARRELEEETGLRAECWRLLARVDTTPGFCTEQIDLYLATGLSQHAPHTDPDEFLHITRIPLQDAAENVMNGEIQDAKTALGLLMARDILLAGKTFSVRDMTSIQRGKDAFASPEA